MGIRRNIYILCGISLLHGMVFYGAVATLYRQAAGLGLFEITLIESISLALSLALELPWGMAAEKLGYKKTMIVCCGLYFASKIIFWRAEGFGMFLAERVLLAVVCAGLSGVDAGMLYLSAPEGESQKFFGIYESLGEAGLLLAGAVYTLFVGGNYRLAALLTVLSYGLAALLSLGLAEVRSPEPAEHQGFKAFAGTLKGTLRRPALLMLVLAAALLAQSHQTITVFFAQVKLENCGMQGGAFGLVFLILALAGLTGGLSQRCTRMLGERRFGGMAFLLACASCAALAFTGSIFVAAACAVLLRLAYMLSAPLFTRLQNEQVRTQNRATELSVNAVLMDGVAVMTNLVFGRLAEVNLAHAMLLGAAFCAAGFMLWQGFYHFDGGFDNGK